MLVIENLSTVMQLLALNRHEYRHFPAFRQRRTRRRTLASTFRETEEGSPLRGSSSATVKKEGPSNRPSPLHGSTGSASINNPCHPCRHRAWQASVSPSWVSPRPSPLS